MTIDKHSGFSAIENREVIIDKSNINSTKLLEATEIANQQSSHRNNRFYYLNRGVFWGGIFALNALISACLGAALTTIEPIDRGVRKAVGNSFAIASKEKTAKSEKIVNTSPLTKPINLLVVEIEPTKPAPEESPRAFVGNSNTILLLQFDPQKQVAKLINIPLDSKVRIPGFGWNTIANANRYGGIPLVSQAVSQMNGGTSINRYLRATPETFKRLNLTLEKLASSNECMEETSNCTNSLQHTRQQEKFFETLRQRLQNRQQIADLTKTIKAKELKIDTNLSGNEAISIANFLGELKPKQISVSEPIEYTQYQAKSVLQRELEDSSDNSNYFSLQDATGSINSVPLTLSTVNRYSHPFHHTRIAVQNTTDRPELGMRVVAYLMKYNFQNVSLVEHIPLNLENTEIAISSSNLRAGTYLQQVLNLGHLKLADTDSNRKLVIRIGEDAQYLTIENGFLR